MGKGGGGGGGGGGGVGGGTCGYIYDRIVRFALLVSISSPASDHLMIRF